MPTRTGAGNIFRTADGGVSFTDTGVSGLAVDFASATRAVAVGFGGRTRSPMTPATTSRHSAHGRRAASS